MIVGSIGYDCHSGLAHLMRDFFNHALVHRVMVTPHPNYPAVPDMYPSDVVFNKKQVNEFLDGMTSLLLFEVATGNTWDVVRAAQDRGIKIVLMPNYEYTPYPMPVRPDLIVCASDLDERYYEKDYNTTRINVPVDQKWIQRTKALKFVHHAGHGQFQYAKGTPQIIEAMSYVKSPIILRVTGQPSDSKIKRLFDKHRNNPRINIEAGDLPQERMWQEDDVFVNAEQYNGISLMLQEARASGMLVISTNRFPMNKWLPTEPLIPVERYEKLRICVELDRAVIDPKAIAAKIDEYYGQDISKYSEEGLKWGVENSWTNLAPKWRMALT